MTETTLPPWLQDVIQRVLQARRQDRLGQALLFWGNDKAAWSLLLPALRSRLLCLDGSGVMACGVCSNCQLLQAGSHPDAADCVPEAPGKDIRIDQVRELSEFIYSTPQIADRRILLLYPAEALNLPSANALLKTLEEPAGHSLLLLATSNPSRLPATVRSRCERIHVATPAVEMIRTWLLQHGVAAADAEQALRGCPDAPLAALQMCQQEDIAVYRNTLDLWQQYLAGQRDVFSVAAEWAKLEPEKIIGWLSSAVHQQAREAAIGNDAEGLQRQLECWMQLQHMLKSVHERRHLNAALQWERWLMGCRRKQETLTPLARFER